MTNNPEVEALSPAERLYLEVEGWWAEMPALAGPASFPEGHYWYLLADGTVLAGHGIEDGGVSWDKTGTLWIEVELLHDIDLRGGRVRQDWREKMFCRPTEEGTDAHINVSQLLALGKLFDI